MFNVLGYLGGRGRCRTARCLRPGQHGHAGTARSAGDRRGPPADGKARGAGAWRRGKFSFTATDELGIYEAQANGKTFQRFAVNLFDPTESDIRPAKDLAIKIGYVEVAGATGWEAGAREIWKELLLLGLAVSLLEWYIYTRRVIIDAVDRGRATPCRSSRVLPLYSVICSKRKSLCR